MMTTIPADAAIARVNILGAGISALTMPLAVARILAWVEQGARQYVSVCTVHSVMEGRRSPAMRQAINGAGLATPDGMPLVWLGRRWSSAPVSRVYGPDLLLEVCRASVERGYSHFFLGGAAGVPELLAQKLQARFPGLAVAGAFSPPFRALSPAEDEQLIDRLNAAKPDIIWVGLGTPKQDLWMAGHRSRLDSPVLVGVGAAFDFHAGRIAQAPRWMQQAGLEWLFRLRQEPRRLWYRYLVYNPLFIALIAAQAAGLKRYPLE